MSHLPEREEKICLNCNAALVGRYCHACGQENVPPKESLWHLTTHFFNDFTHFDGKFFSTLKILLFRPGFLTTEYVRGRRAAYLNPIRMFLFVSFVLFLVIFSVPDQEQPAEADTAAATDTLLAVRSAEPSLQLGSVPERTDSTPLRRQISISNNEIYLSTPLLTPGDSTLAAYNARMASLPPGKRHNLVQRYINRKFIAFNHYAASHPDTWDEDLVEGFTHSVPKMFFLTLPFFAFFLYLLYLRRRRQYYYSSHGIFSLHYYTAAYIIVTAFFLLEWIGVSSGYITLGCFLLVCTYLYIAMLKFYRQGWFKTLLKFLIVSFLAFFFTGILTLFFFIGTLVSLAKG